MKQCKKCPWRKDVDPHDIPNGYCEIKHANLRSTIVKPADLSSLGRDMHLMACHESNTPGKERPCVGWVSNQLGAGNNLQLRLAALDGRFSNLKLVGEQHETFDDTLPRKGT